MQFVIQKSEFLQALQQVTKAIPSRTPKPILTGVLITAKDQKLTLTGYDLEIGIQVDIENHVEDGLNTLQIEQEGEIVLQAKFLLEITRKLPHSLMRIDVQQVTVTLQSGNAVFQLNGLDPREYPDLPIVDDDRGFVLSSGTLKNLIDHTSFAVASSEVRPTIMGVLWRYDEGKLTLTGTDSHRLSKDAVEVESQESYAMMESIIPGKSLQELARILPDDEMPVDIMIENQQLLVTFGHVRFLSGLIEGTFPDTSRIIPTTFRTIIVFTTDELRQSVERADLLARDNDNNIVRFSMRRNNIEIMSHSPEIGKVVESIDPITFEGEDMMIACNARYLLEALRQSPTERVRIEFTGQGSPFLLRPVGKEDLMHLILPVRIANL
nr:DNA polymerase III subunit beta [Bacilli bacterium]